MYIIEEVQCDEMRRTDKLTHIGIGQEEVQISSTQTILSAYMYTQISLIAQGCEDQSSTSPHQSKNHQP